jgi:putative transposase
MDDKTTQYKNPPALSMVVSAGPMRGQVGWLTVAEAAALVGRDESTIRRWKLDGRVEWRQPLAGGAIEIRAESLAVVRVEDEPTAVALSRVDEEERPALLGTLARVHVLLAALLALPVREDHAHRPTPEAAALLAALEAALPDRCRRRVVRALSGKRLRWQTVRRLLTRLPARPVGLLETRWSPGRPPKMPAEAVAFIEGVWLQGTLRRVTTVHRVYEREAARRGWPRVSVDTVRRALRGLDARHPDFIRARRGDRAYNLEAAPFVRRDPKGYDAGELYVGDQHELDLFVWSPPSRRRFRPWLTCWRDMRTGTIVGWEIAAEHNSDTIAAAFLHACSARKDVPGYERVHGVPRGVLVDNGKDYRARRFVEAFGPLQGAFEGLGIGVHFALPYNAKAKPIERTFRDVTEDFSCRLPGYCGNRAGYESAKLARELEAHDGFEDGAGVPTPLLTLDELRAQFAAWVVSHGLERSRKLHDAGEVAYTPLGLWNHLIADAQRGHKLDQLDDETLRLALLRSDLRTVQKGGYLREGGHWYVHEALVRRRGALVKVAVDPGEEGALHVWDARGEFVCVARNRKLTGEGATVADLAEVKRLRRAEGERFRRAQRARRVIVGDVDALLRPTPPAVPAAAPLPAVREVVSRLRPEADAVRVARLTDGARREERAGGEAMASALLAPFLSQARAEEEERRRAEDEARPRYAVNLWGGGSAREQRSEDE